MKQVLLLIVLLANTSLLSAQELYVYTEPASNMPAKTLGVRFTSTFPNTYLFKQRYMPEVMIGINKKWMAHLSSTFSDLYTENLRFESAKAYLKYRFLSHDDVHKHFRMAAFVNGSFTHSPYIFDEVNLTGNNDGVGGGLIATQLVHKLAVSATTSYTRVITDVNTHQHREMSKHMMDYSLSAGYLLLPKEYKDYDQTNLNMYVEMLGMKSLDANHYGIDLAPALQLIIHSNLKLNVGYRFRVAGNMYRIADQTFLAGMEYTFYSVFK